MVQLQLGWKLANSHTKQRQENCLVIPCNRGTQILAPERRLLHEYQEFVEILRQRCLTVSPAFALLQNLQFAQSVSRSCLQDQIYSPNTILLIEKMSSVSICGLRFFISSRLILHPVYVRREWLCFCPHLVLTLDTLFVCHLQRIFTAMVPFNPGLSAASSTLLWNNAES